MGIAVVQVAELYMPKTLAFLIVLEEGFIFCFYANMSLKITNFAFHLNRIRTI